MLHLSIDQTYSHCYIQAMNLTVEYSKAAAKFISRMPRKTALTLVGKINTYAANPTGSHAWAKPLTGVEGVRIRQGDYRAVCSIVNNKATFMVYKVGNRKDVYK